MFDNICKIDMWMQYSILVLSAQHILTNHRPDDLCNPLVSAGQPAYPLTLESHFDLHYYSMVLDINILYSYSDSIWHILAIFLLLILVI